MSRRLLVTMLLSLVALIAAALPAAAAIQVYGRESCGNCQALKRSLEAAKVAFEYYDIDRDAARKREMWTKVRSVDASKRSITLPVVDVGGKVLLTAPTSYEALKPYLGAGDAEKKTAGAIVVYGREESGYCRALRGSLDAAGAAYVFHDVTQDRARYREMWKKIKVVDASLRTVTYPVVEVNGKLLLTHPTTYEALKPYLAKGDATDNKDGDDADTKEAGGSFTAFQRAVLAEVNLARTAPGEYIKKRLAAEGRAGTDNGAVADLKKQQPVAAVRLEARLCAAATKYAKFLADNNRWGHNEQGTPFTRIKAEGYVYRTAGENIAAGSYPGQNAEEDATAAAIAFVKQWIIDRGVPGVGHRVNIFRPGYTEMGIGFGRNEGARYVNYAVQDFGAPL